MSRKLRLLLAGFAVSNFVVAMTSSYQAMVAFRVLWGLCAGVMSPTIAAYGTRLAPEHMHGRAITVIMSGNTLGISNGLPVMTMIGVTFDWRAAFAVLGLIVAAIGVAIGVLAYLYIPSVKGERMSRTNSPWAITRMPAILIVLLLTFLSVVAHYGIHTYITLLVRMLDLVGGIGFALLIFSIGNLMNIVDTAIHLAQTMSFEDLDRALDLITHNGAKTLNVEGQYGIEEGKPANFHVLDADSPFEAVRTRADVLASIRGGEYLFQRPGPSFDIELDLFRKTR